MRKRSCQLIILTVLLAAPRIGTFAGEFTIGSELTRDGKVRVCFAIPQRLKAERIELYRSPSNLTDVQIDLYSYPITRFTLAEGGKREGFVDESVAHNVTYHYVAKIASDTGSGASSNVASISVPNVVLDSLSRPTLLIDKVHYFLEVRDGGESKKRYPVALGRNPAKRKLHQDNSSTPEGTYEITNLQPRATFYKAYDIDYPNPVDRIRYNFARAEKMIRPRGGAIPGIGGQIQIHGMGIETNWTWGCVALRNADIDELFTHKEIGRGTTVIIVGEEITREDIAAISRSNSPNEIQRIQTKLAERGYDVGTIDGILGIKTRYAVGRFQSARGLPTTCDLDRRTVDALLGEQRHHRTQIP